MGLAGTTLPLDHHANGAGLATTPRGLQALQHERHDVAVQVLDAVRQGTPQVVADRSPIESKGVEGLQAVVGHLRTDRQQMLFLVPDRHRVLPVTLIQRLLVGLRNQVDVGSPIHEAKRLVDLGTLKIG